MNQSAETEDFEVTFVSGVTSKVLSRNEKLWFEQSRDTYLAETKFTEMTDLRDLDRLLGMELTVFRLQQYLNAGHDYDGFEVDDVLLRRNVREYSEQINRTKDAMGLTKKARAGAANEGDFVTWLNNLKVRAKTFGIHREQQLGKALTLFEELSSIVGAYDRSDEEERHKLGFTSEKDIVEWIRHTMIPEYRLLDAHFREHEQKFWIRNQ